MLEHIYKVLRCQYDKIQYFCTFLSFRVDPDEWVYDDTIDDSGIVRGARKKKEFKYLLPKDEVQSMVKMGKGSKRGLTEAVMKTDGRGMEWFE